MLSILRQSFAPPASGTIRVHIGKGRSRQPVRRTHRGRREDQTPAQSYRHQEASRTACYDVITKCQCRNSSSLHGNRTLKHGRPCALTASVNRYSGHRCLTGRCHCWISCARIGITGQQVAVENAVRPWAEDPSPPHCPTHVLTDNSRVDITPLGVADSLRRCHHFDREHRVLFFVQSGNFITPDDRQNALPGSSLKCTASRPRKEALRSAQAALFSVVAP